MMYVPSIGYLVSTTLFIVGLKYLSIPSKAAKGNSVAAIGMVLAVAVTLLGFSMDDWHVNKAIILILAIGAGVFLGRSMSRRVEMTRMPQLISLFNATGGACAMLIGISETMNSTEEGLPPLMLSLIWLSVSIGAMSLTGSLVAIQKLSNKWKLKVGPRVRRLNRILPLLITAIAVVALLGISGYSTSMVTVMISLLALLYGVTFVWPIGGADMPVVISLLNALTGVATALTGVLFDNKIMIAGGIFVGAAGLILTLMMCKAMNRPLINVLLGAKNSSSTGSSASSEIVETSVAEVTTQMAFAQKVAIIPGYGLAVAQAQQLCGQLQKSLLARTTEVDFIIHPVAGRMPGHMNVLLAEADIDYEHLYEMSDVNDQMNAYDMVLVVGANDVVNPAAERNEDSPIYGMPIIKAHEAKQVVVVKRSMNTGYAGIENELFSEPNCKLLFGDAKLILKDILTELKHL
ncbi:NAD(P)(+) transhydrogenase (Re/Si-specific) subunit beta [Phaeocystidibacter marisrubri]|uniref:NAD(P) transhydrogenase subunit beta n=1 Tax=Phaeocystidibacter marisrubri TaxID=1577780 RepID=A0A6L3ZDI4_9FLAO|nr:NAD(P)(+) transhydrogenase (Re/Si-specific) subunit beta [Phaeocystidibacter marisrubri]KAB2815628.1 NAD(P)(+) transhydrogenase (Re/Si-specific) subunit beta [Phaeocystidibacter marisrubri]GGH64880.1 NAD(P) transhydrogenase subunit beta [Phaeocystidibacter marisrubri]